MKIWKQNLPSCFMPKIWSRAMSLNCPFCQVSSLFRWIHHHQIQHYLDTSNISSFGNYRGEDIQSIVGGIAGMVLGSVLNSFTEHHLSRIYVFAVTATKNSPFAISIELYQNRFKFHFKRNTTMAHQIDQMAYVGHGMVLAISWVRTSRLKSGRRHGLAHWIVWS